MGPTNVALVNLFRAEQALREATSTLEAVTKDVRAQEVRNAQLTTRLETAQAKFKDLQAKSANFDLDLKMREEHIDKLRERQASAANNKEYQAMLIEINTSKTDRAKIEEQAIRLMEQVEAAGNEVKSLTALLETETGKLNQMKAEVGDKAAAAQAEVDRRTPARNAAAAVITKPGLLAEFNRLANRYEGEALAHLEKPNPREDEYLCTGCQMSLVADVFNKLKTRDETVACPSCRRFLYLPEGATYESSVTKRAPSTKTGSRSKSDRVVKKIMKADAELAVPESKWHPIVTAAQGESVRDAKEADHKPVECTVEINGESVGVFKGKSAEHLERVIRFRMEETKMGADVKVTLVAAPTA